MVSRYSEYRKSSAPELAIGLVVLLGVAHTEDQVSKKEHELWIVEAKLCEPLIGDCQVVMDFSFAWIAPRINLSPFEFKARIPQLMVG
jgi:hypothetical protein